MPGTVGSRCPSCARRFSFSVFGPGALSACQGCGVIVVFTDLLDARAVSPDELRALPLFVQGELLQIQRRAREA